MTKIDFFVSSTDGGEVGGGILKNMWHEGMQLLPQHFQVTDARIDALLRLQMCYEQPLAWGLDLLELDEVALSKGMLDVKKIAGRFPDGYFFHFDTTEAGTRLSCSVEEVGREAVRYAVCIPKRDFTQNNAAVQRYAQFAGKPISDVTNPTESAVVVRWAPNLSIQKFDLQNEASYFQIPFIDVIRNAVGYEALDFHPPAVRLIKGSSLVRELVRFITLIKTKAVELGVGPLPVKMPPEYKVGPEWVSVSLLMYLPRLEVHLMSPETHPMTILGDLCDMAGVMVPLLTGKPQEKLPIYDHADPGASIRFLTHFLTEMITRIGVTQSRLAAIPFDLHGDDWRCVLPTSFTGNELIVKVRFLAGKSENFVISWLSYALIAFEEDKNKCRELRIKGLARQGHVSIPNLGLEAESSVRYIVIDHGMGPGGMSNVLGRTLVVSGLSHEHKGQVLAEVALVVINQDKG